MASTALNPDPYTAFTVALANCSDAISGGTFGTAQKYLAVAQVALAACPEDVLTGQKTTRFRKLEELAQIRVAIQQAQASASGDGLGGTGLGYVKFARAQ